MSTTEKEVALVERIRKLASDEPTWMRKDTEAEGPWYVHTCPGKLPLVSAYEGPPRDRVIAAAYRGQENHFAGELIAEMINALPTLLALAEEALRKRTSR